MIIGFSDDTMVSNLSIKLKIFCRVRIPFQKCQAFYVVCPKGPLLFLIYDMPMTVKCNLFLYADDTCLVFQVDNIKDIEKQIT